MVQVNEFVYVPAETGFMYWGPGDFAHIPRCTVHAFTNNDAEAVRMVAIFSPAGMEGWFAESYGAAPDRKATPPPPSPAMLARMLTAAPKYGVVFA